MAKWEDKDPKWIVQDRQDGSNVNGEADAPCYGTRNTGVAARDDANNPYIARLTCRLALGREKPVELEQAKA